MKKLVVFDLDGTLNRTDLFSVPAHLKALAQRGITHVTKEEIVDTFGERAQEYVKKLAGELSPEEERRYLDDVAKYEAELIAINGRPYDGVFESLSHLKADGYQTAICSNSSTRYITMVLREIGIDVLIDVIQDLHPGMNKIETLKLLLEQEKPTAAVMVGDRCFDIEAGKKNGLKTIGCRYGFQPAESEEADVVIDSAYDIYEAVKRLI